MSLTVKRDPSPGRQRSVDETDGRVPPDGAPVRQLTDPPVALTFVAVGEEVGDAVRKLLEGPRLVAHGAMLTVSDDSVKLSPAELVQPSVINTEVVGNLMNDRDRDLLDHVLLVVADVEDRLAIDGDPVRQHAAVVGRALRQRHAVVEPEQRGVLGVAVLDQDHDVLHGGHELARDEVEGVADQLLEPLARHGEAHGRFASTSTAWRWSRRAGPARGRPPDAATHPLRARRPCSSPSASRPPSSPASACPSTATGSTRPDPCSPSTATPLAGTGPRSSRAAAPRSGSPRGTPGRGLRCRPPRTSAPSSSRPGRRPPACSPGRSRCPGHGCWTGPG